MKALGIALGLLGLFVIIVSAPIGLLMIIVGALCVISASNSEKRQMEEHRHQETLAAIRQSQVQPTSTRIPQSRAKASSKTLGSFAPPSDEK